MSESFATSRPVGGAEEFDRRRRSLGDAPGSQPDPLAELARLVGQTDPFRVAKPQIRPTITPAEPSLSPRDSFAGFERDFRGAIDAGEEAGAPDDPAVVHAALASAPSLSRVAEQAGAPPREPRAPEVSADSWARGMAPAVEAQDTAAVRDAPASHPGSSRRTLVVLGAVVALTAGGLAASFLAKPSGAGVTASSAATPTILAATGPSKVQPAPAADARADAPSEPSTLLDKNKNDGTATAKVVNSVEQPVDLSQAVKPPPGAEVAQAAASPPSPFPEPRRVKTVLVRPDGSIISDRPATAPDSAGQGTAADQQSSLAFDPKTSLPVAPGQQSNADAAGVASAPPPPPVPAAATPAPGKSQARVAVTPKTSGPAAGATPPAKPAAAKPSANPVEEANAVAPAADTPTASLPSGKFAAQLGAAGSEAEARDLSARLSRKFADAVAGRLSVHKAQSGDKTVFRLRVGGLSQEAAKALCAKVSSGGGGCFVARD